jgi:hypothetical protein
LIDCVASLSVEPFGKLTLLRRVLFLALSYHESFCVSDGFTLSVASSAAVQNTTAVIRYSTV